MESPHLPTAVEGWLASWRADGADVLGQDPDFARWLEEEYVPLAGGWQY